MIGLLIAGLLQSPVPEAANCTSLQMQQVLEVTDTPLTLTCSVILPTGQSITRPLRLAGPQASGIVVDCVNGTIGRLERPVSTSTPTVAIWSEKSPQGLWRRPTDISIRNCHIIGNIRIWGMGADGQYDDLRASSQRADHIARTQAAAPSRIQLQNLTITGRGSIPLYVGPGVTGVSLSASTLNGISTATAIYLDAESANISIRNNRLHTRTGRELLAIDASANNTISGNFFELRGQAGILLYRNCGERGVVRHQTPSHNRIEDNRFTGGSWLRPRHVIENARNGRRSYCRDDAGYPFGSSLDDRDNGSHNIIRNNGR